MRLFIILFFFEFIFPFCNNKEKFKFNVVMVKKVDEHEEDEVDYASDVEEEEEEEEEEGSKKEEKTPIVNAQEKNQTRSRDDDPEGESLKNPEKEEEKEKEKNISDTVEKASSEPKGSNPERARRVDFIESKKDEETEEERISFSLLLPSNAIPALSKAKETLLSSYPNTRMKFYEGGENDRFLSSVRKVVRFGGTWKSLYSLQKEVLDLVASVQSKEKLNQEEMVLIPYGSVKSLSKPFLAELEKAHNVRAQVYQGYPGFYSLILLQNLEENKEEGFSSVISEIKKHLGIICLPGELPSEEEEANKDDHFELNIPVPAKYAGGVIGKNASIVKSMEEDSGARINLSKLDAKVVTPRAVIRFVHVSGTRDQLKLAQPLVLKQIEAAKARIDAESADISAEFSIPLSVPDSLIGVIIGKGGNTLKQIQSETKTRIRVEHTSSSSKKKEIDRLVDIMGTREDAEKTQKIIVERLVVVAEKRANNAYTRDRDNYTRGERRSSYNVNNNNERGETKRFRQDYDDDRYSDRHRHHSSSRRDNYNSRDNYRDDRRDHYRDRDRDRSSNRDRQQTTLEMRIPLDQVGAVIGARGATIRRISEACNARLNIESKERLRPGARDRLLTISGAKTDANKAYEMVRAELSNANHNNYQQPPPQQYTNNRRGSYDNTLPPPRAPYQQSNYYPQAPSNYPQQYGSQGPPYGDYRGSRDYRDNYERRDNYNSDGYNTSRRDSYRDRRDGGRYGDNRRDDRNHAYGDNLPNFNPPHSQPYGNYPPQQQYQQQPHRVGEQRPDSFRTPYQQQPQQLPFDPRQLEILSQLAQNLKPSDPGATRSMMGQITGKVSPQQSTTPYGDHKKQTGGFRKTPGGGN